MPSEPSNRALTSADTAEVRAATNRTIPAEEAHQLLPDRQGTCPCGDCRGGRARCLKPAICKHGAGSPSGGVPPEASAEPAWYVIHCYSGYENKVRHNLEQRIETMGMKDKIFDVVIPTQEEIEVKDGKRRTVERHIFPGYVLVNMTLSEESWYVVRNTPGVTGFVGMGNTAHAAAP